MHVKIWKVREHVDVRVHVVVRTNDRSSYRIQGRGWWSRYSKGCGCEGVSRNLSFRSKRLFYVNLVKNIKYPGYGP